MEYSNAEEWYEIIEGTDYKVIDLFQYEGLVESKDGSSVPMPETLKSLYRGRSLENLQEIGELLTGIEALKKKEDTKVYLFSTSARELLETDDVEAGRPFNFL